MNAQTQIRSFESQVLWRRDPDTRFWQDVRVSSRTMRAGLAMLIRRFPPIRDLIDNAFRIDDRVRQIRVSAVRRRGYQTLAEPYTGYGTTSWVRVLARVQMVPPPSRRLRVFARRRKERALRGWRSFTRIAAGNVPTTVIIDGARHQVMADRGGVIDVNLPATLEPGWREVEFESFDGHVTVAPVFITADDQHVGLISDIDDTVMVTALPRPLLAAWNTFVLDEHARTPTPGMNVFYERTLRAIGYEAAPVIYLSTGPWNVAPTLARFLGRNLYPAGALLLTDWGPTPQRLFRSGTEHKIDNLERLASEFPHMKWLLVGDDGQHDEEIYGRFAEKHPENVLAVAIRQLSTSEAVLAGGRSLTPKWRKDPNVPWVYGPDGSALVARLRDEGLLGDEDVIESEIMAAFHDEIIDRNEYHATGGERGDLNPRG